MNHDSDASRPSAQYFKRRDSAVAVIYVQRERSWASYASGGVLLMESVGTIPESTLARLEPIDEDTAKRLLAEPGKEPPPVVEVAQPTPRPDPVAAAPIVSDEQAIEDSPKAIDSHAEDSSSGGPTESSFQGVRYYKSLDPLLPIVYVQGENQWESYAPGGIIGRKAGMIPPGILPLTEEIGQAEAEELIGLRLADADSIERQRSESRECSHVLPTEPAALGGWLILPIIGLFVSIVSSAVLTHRDFFSLVSDGSWSELVDSGSATYSLSLAMGLAFEAAVNFAIVFASIALLILIFRRRPIVPTLIVWFYISELAGVFLYTVWLTLAMRSTGYTIAAVEYADAGLTDIARGIFATAIWIPYFLVSRRVRNTFVDWSVQTVEEECSQRTSRRRLAWSLTAVSLAILVGIGVFAWKVETLPSSAYAESPRSTVKRYTNADYGYSFEYPAAWLIREGVLSDWEDIEGIVSGVMAISTDSSADVFFVQLLDLGFTLENSMIGDLRSVMEGIAVGVLELDPSCRVRSPVDSERVGDLGGYTFAVGVALDGVPLIWEYHYLWHGDEEYHFMFQAAEEDWEESADTFEAVLASFKPGTQ